MASDYRILVVGDCHVGKSSLITSFLRESDADGLKAGPSHTVQPVVSVPGLGRTTLYVVDTQCRSGMAALVSRADIEHNDRQRVLPGR